MTIHKQKEVHNLKFNLMLFFLLDEGVYNEPGEAHQTAGAGPHRWQGELIIFRVLLFFFPSLLLPENPHSLKV